MTKSNKFSPEVKERAVRLVQEHRGEYSSLWAAVESIAPKIGCRLMPKAKEMAAEGYSQRAIATKLGVGHRTIGRWLKQENRS